MDKMDRDVYCIFVGNNKRLGKFKWLKVNCLKGLYCDLYDEILF